MKSISFDYSNLCGIVAEDDIKSMEEALFSAKESILRGAINCYALEGVYPPDYEYLKENYGVRVDEEKYAVFYTVFASNIMPDVTVVEK